MLIVGTLGPEEITGEHPQGLLRATWRSSRTATGMQIGPRNPIDTASLASQVTRRQLAPDLATDLYKETEGNPLFIVETVRMGVGEITGKEHLSKAEPHRSKLPHTVQADIAARLEQPSPQVRDVGNLAATNRPAFTFSVLARAPSARQDKLILGLDER